MDWWQEFKTKNSIQNDSQDFWFEQQNLIELLENKAFEEKLRDLRGRVIWGNITLGMSTRYLSGQLEILSLQFRKRGPS